MEAANMRAEAANEQARHRLNIEERDQLIKLHKIGVYSKEELLEKLRALEDKPKKRARTRSPSPVKTQSPSPAWDIEHPDYVLSS